MFRKLLTWLYKLLLLVEKLRNVCVSFRVSRTRTLPIRQTSVIPTSSPAHDNQHAIAFLQRIQRDSVLLHDLYNDPDAVFAREHLSLQLQRVILLMLPSLMDTDTYHPFTTPRPRFPFPFD